MIHPELFNEHLQIEQGVRLEVAQLLEPVRDLQAA